MIIKEPGSNAYSLYLIIGMISLVLIGADIISNTNPAADFIRIAPFWQHVFIAWMFIGHLLYLRNITESREIFSIETLLMYIILCGAVCLPLNYIPEMLVQINFTWFPSRLHKAILDLMKNYSTIIYFLFSLVMFRKLVFVRKTKQVINRWNFFFGWLILVTLIAPLTELFLWQLDDLFYYVMIAIGAIAGASLLSQLKWIALLNTAAKWRCIIYLAVITFVSAAILFKLDREQDNYIVQGIKHYNLFLILVSSFTTVYGATSLLALFFNLPVASVLEQQKNEMQSFQEITQIIKNKVNIQDILEQLFTACITNIQAEGGWLTYKLDAVTGEKKTLKSVNVTEEEILSIDERINKHNLLFPEMTVEYVNVTNLNKSVRFDQVRTDYQSMLICPIITGNVIIGKIVLLKSYKGGFDQYMINLASSYIDQAKIAIESTKSLKEAFETERLKEELAIAKKIQKSILARDFPTNGKYEVAAFSESAREVGGDYYDFYRISESRAAVVIGDVSGKGTSAAFHMAELKGIFQALIQLDLSPRDFMIRTNTAINNCLERNLFITFSFFLIDSEKKAVSYSRAGHCPVLIFRSKENKSIYLEDEGIGLGIIRTGDFSRFVTVHEFNYSKNDVLLLYSDGIVEARIKGGETEFGYQRLQASLQKHKALGASGIKDSILRELNEFAGSGERLDDLTMVVIKFN